jgi:hypothetical protein
MLLRRLLAFRSSEAAEESIYDGACVKQVFPRAKCCGLMRSDSTMGMHGERNVRPVYEALPQHRLFPARSGLTSRFQLQKQKRGCRGSTELPIVVASDPGAKFLMETGYPIEQMKNSLNYVSTCLRVVDTRRSVKLLTRESHPVAVRGT